MNLNPAIELRDNDIWRQVLAAYETEQAVRKRIDPDHRGWVQRLRTIDGVPDEEMSAIHGKLIAFGFLKVQLTSRNEGIQYQIGPAANPAQEMPESPDR